MPVSSLKQKSMKRIIFLLAIAFSLTLSAKKNPAIVILTAGQSNTDGRVMNTELPSEIQQNKYKYCQWSFGSGTLSGEGRFETFWPRIVNKNNPNRYAYDAIVYYKLEQKLKKPFYVIKESLGGTAIDTLCPSTNKMYWSADPAYLARTEAADKGGKSLLKAFTDNIGACIDNQLLQLPEGYDIKVLLWHQGESDRHKAKNYYKNLKEMIQYVRNFLVQKTGNRKYANLPIVLGGVAHKSKQYTPAVEEAKHQLAKEDKNIYVVDVPDASLRKDVLHFDAAGAEELGAKVYNLLIDKKILK